MIAALALCAVGPLPVSRLKGRTIVKGKFDYFVKNFRLVAPANAGVQELRL